MAVRGQRALGRPLHFLQLRGRCGMAGSKRQRAPVTLARLVQVAALAIPVAKTDLSIGGTGIALRSIREDLERSVELLLAE